MPCLVYFENGVPELYSGDLLNDNAIMKWMMSELKQVSSRYFRKLDRFVATPVIKLKSFKQKENIQVYNVFFWARALEKTEAHAWSKLETANESETRLVCSSTACPIYNKLVS